MSKLEKPSVPETILYKNGSVIEGIILKYVQIGTDIAQTRAKLHMSNDVVLDVSWDAYRPYIDIEPNWYSIAALKEGSVKRCEIWDQYLKENSEELAEYERLKKKFEGRK